jgi:type I restriction enzyme S subunit
MSLVRLGEIIRLEYGKPLPENDRNSSGPYPAFGANGVKARTNRYFYEKPSIIVGRKGSAGELTLTEGKFWPLDVTYFVKHDEQKTDLLYIYYLLKKLNLPSMARGVKPGINRNDIYAIRVSLPSLTEQRKVVAKLESSFRKINQATKLIDQEHDYTRRLFSTQLESIFENQSNGEKVKIQDVCSIKGGKRLPKGDKLTAQKTPYPYIRVTDFDHHGSIDVDNIQYLHENTHKQISNYIITDSDVFLSIAGSIGITGIIPASFNGANLTENACRMIPNSSLDKEYLYYFTLTNSFIDQAAGATRQTAQPKLALIRIKNIELYVPSKDKQLGIVERLKTLSQKIETISRLHIKKLESMDALKKSMLNTAFSVSDVE